MFTICLFTNYFPINYSINYPINQPTGTNERVCLISGTIDGVLKISEFIMEKIKEKPDPNAKMAIDFDHKQPAEREKQVSHFPFSSALPVFLPTLVLFP